jgi:hypothetical protein
MERQMGCVGAGTGVFVGVAMGDCGPDAQAAMMVVNRTNRREYFFILISV